MNSDTRPKITELLKLLDHKDQIELQPAEKTYLEGWKHALIAIKSKNIEPINILNKSTRK